MLLFAAQTIGTDFKNFTYIRNPCPENVPVAAIVRKGKFDYFDKREAVSFEIYVDAVTEGVLQQGTRQAVVVLECEFPLGGTAAAYAFDKRKNGAVLLGEVARADWGADWGVGPSSIRVHFTRHILVVQQCTDDDCTKKQEATYALRSGKLVRLSVRTWNP